MRPRHAPRPAVRSAMTRLCWLVLVTLVAAAPTVRAQEPSFRGRPLSEWLKMLESDPKPEHRQAALMVVEVLGSKASTTVRAVGKAARTDANADVRRQAV